MSLHGGLMSIFGKGVLILGREGVGKSQLMLTLMDRGHTLVADDLVLVESTGRHGQLEGFASPHCQGQLAIRNLGIFDARTLYPKQWTERVKVSLAIQLVSDTERTSLLGKDQFLTIGESQLPLYIINTQQNRPLALMIECVVKRDFN